MGSPEALWGLLGPPMIPLGASLWNVCGPYGASWSTLGRLRVSRAPLLEVLGGFWAMLEHLERLFLTSWVDLEAFQVFFLVCHAFL